VTDPHASALEALGIQRGEAVRFRRASTKRWQAGQVDRLERDGSLRVTDADGAARTVPLALVQVRNRKRWENVTDRAGRARQLVLDW
jgi:hypothetical protein